MLFLNRNRAQVYSDREVIPTFCSYFNLFYYRGLLHVQWMTATPAIGGRITWPDICFSIKGNNLNAPWRTVNADLLFRVI